MFSLILNDLDSDLHTRSHYTFSINQGVLVFLMFLLVIPVSEFMLLLNLFNFQVISFF